jgi:branched-chain amino acid transport system ATP-binding protein
MLISPDLNTYYGDSHILRGVDPHIPAGTSVGLLGRNGMGKTTLIRTLMGYVRHGLGQVQSGTAATSPAGRPRRWRAWASATCPKGAASFPTCRCARTCDERAPGVDGRAPGPSTACWRPFRA